jgi:hypothetical protein
MRRCTRTSIYRRLVASTVTPALLAAWLWAPVAAGHTAAAAEPAVTVTIAEGMEDADRLRTWIVDAGNQALRDGGHDPDTVADTLGTIAIDVQGELYDYDLSMTVTRASGRTDALDPLDCECTYDELLDKIGPRLDAAVERLQAPPDPTGPTDPDPPVTSPPTNPETPGRAPLGTLGKAGIATLVIGAAGLVTGGVLVGIGSRQGLSGDEIQREDTNLQPPGWALVGVGAAAVVTGAVLLGVDRARAKRSRAPVAFVGPMNPRTPGLFVHGRF